MAESVPPNIIAFIKEFLPKVKIKNVDYGDLHIGTSLDLDLNMYDIDLDLFLWEFCEKFGIDNSEFKWPKGQYPQDPPFAVAILRTFFDYRSDWVKKKVRSLYKPKIFINDLVESIKTGKLHLGSDIIIPPLVA